MTMNFTTCTESNKNKKPSVRQVWWLTTLLVLSTTAISGCLILKTSETTLERADRLREAGKFEQAIACYRKHLNERLGKGWRPNWENPYFYLLIIGDVYLESKDPVRALQNYELALSNDVSQELVADRFLSLALWYEEQGEIEKAVRLLETKKDLDSLLYNAVIDRLNKTIIQAEQLELEAEETLPEE